MDLFFDLNTNEPATTINTTSPQSYYSSSNENNFSPPPSSVSSLNNNPNTMISIDDFILDSNWSQTADSVTNDSTLIVSNQNQLAANDNDSDSGISSNGGVINQLAYMKQNQYESVNSRSQSISNSSISSMIDLNESSNNKQIENCMNDIPNHNNLIAALDSCFYDNNSNDLNSIFESSPSSDLSSTSSSPASLLMPSDDINDENLVYKQVDLFLNNLNIDLNNLNNQSNDNQTENLNLFTDNLNNNNNSEQLINNIEYMLMQEMPINEDPSFSNQKQIIKVEPIEYIKTIPAPTTIIVNPNINDNKSLTNNKNYKKISPKLSPKSVILPKPVNTMVPINTPVKNQTIIVNRNNVMPILTVPATNNNKQVILKTNNTTTVRPKSVLLTNTTNSNSVTTPIIISTNQRAPSTNNTIILSNNDENDLPISKKMKQEMPSRLIITNPTSSSAIPIVNDNKNTNINNNNVKKTTKTDEIVATSQISTNSQIDVRIA